MFRICKTIELESGHLLSKHPGNCQFPHGHTRSVELVFAAETLDDHEMVMDFKAIGEMMNEFLEQFDHALCMNTSDPNYAAFRSIYGDRIIPIEQMDPPAKPWLTPCSGMRRRLSTKPNPVRSATRCATA